MNKRVLVLCTGNSCRSQMAEALWQKLGEGKWEALSAGSHPAGYVHPLAVEVMQEIGIDISANTSKPVDELVNQSFDLVVTVCDSAKESCPLCPGAGQILHWPFEDPAAAKESDEEKIAVFRRVRDQIRARIAEYLTRARKNPVPAPQCETPSAR